jgi:ATP-binding protein involved in chromosome partitioning
MAQKTNMRLLGVIENMTGEVFGQGGGAQLAAELGVPLLGSIPLDPRLREQGDLAEPIVAADPEAESSRVLRAIAERVVGTRRERGIGIVKSLPLVS